MQHLEVSGAVRLIYRSLGVKGLIRVPTTGIFDKKNWIFGYLSRRAKHVRLKICFN